MTNKIQLEVYFNKARNLIPSDLNGKSDPYCKVLVGGKKVGKSKKIKKNLDPIWNQRKTFKLKGSYDKLCLQQLSVVVMDWDMISADDNIGEWPGILIRELPPNKEVQYIGKLTKVKTGSINISFKLITSSEIQKKVENAKKKKLKQIEKEKKN
ncbi:tricalbin-1-related [Anaeramoeba flamelloides]|uniref:Tricalbin-1-related n=1 Tax=Anaeramoeba flamelloides TaxID=1746091 RepID=A0AAV8ACM8_9EUKA|nr:tricalbin-1-related [Anaeramoeba flamelloides]KAJ6252725.1 tricalbin-1-related [Anaeramoeba flamelloides]